MPQPLPFQYSPNTLTSAAQTKRWCAPSNFNPIPFCLNFLKPKEGLKIAIKHLVSDHSEWKMYQMFAHTELTDSFKHILTNMTTFIDTPNWMRILHKHPPPQKWMLTFLKSINSWCRITLYTQLLKYAMNAEYMNKQNLIRCVTHHTLHDQNYCQTCCITKSGYLINSTMKNIGFSRLSKLQSIK